VHRERGRGREVHLEEEDSRFSRDGVRNDVGVEHGKQVTADKAYLGFESLAVLDDVAHEGVTALNGALLLVFARRNHPPRLALVGDLVLVGSRQQVPLLDRQFHAQHRHVLDRRHHLCIEPTRTA
jgi:hypothetical protein